MSFLRSPRMRRAPAALLSLALFLLGSNYCLLSAWGGNTRMACMTVASAPVRACSHCGPPAKTSHENRAPARSCCPDPIVTPSAPALDKDAAVAAHLSTPFTAAAVDHDPRITSAWHGPPILHDGQPPTPLVRGSLAARAPPLA